MRKWKKSRANKLDLAEKTVEEIEKIELEDLAKANLPLNSSWVKIASRLNSKPHA